MTSNVDVVLIGGGILGLATALRILEARPSTRLTLIEKEMQVTQHQTGHKNGCH
jgi:L-2-hydroxyglutarate oxidase